MSTDKTPWPFDPLPSILDARDEDNNFRKVRNILSEELGNAAGIRLASKIMRALAPPREFTDPSGVKWREVKDA